MSDSSNEIATPKTEVARREFLSGSSIAMGVGVVASYGTLGVMAGRYVYPAGPTATQWVFVVEARAMKSGDAMEYKSPTGEKIVLTRQADEGTVEDFVALSSVCPHLGCQVHWIAKDNIFFCPCHNGKFSAVGEAIEGPPKAAHQRLPRYEMKIEAGLLYINVPTEAVRVPEESVLAEAPRAKVSMDRRLAASRLARDIDREEA